MLEILLDTRLTPSLQCDYLFKLRLVGDSGVGKSSIIKQYAQESFIDINVNNASVKLQLSDNDNHENDDVYILLFDLTDIGSFINVKHSLEQCQKHASLPACCVLVGNKNDLTDSRAIDFFTALKYANENKIYYVETSAKTGENIKELFSDIAKALVIKRKRKLNVPQDNISVFSAWSSMFLMR